MFRHMPPAVLIGFLTALGPGGAPVSGQGPDAAHVPVPPPRQGHYLLVYSQHLLPVATDWAAYRASQGWGVEMMPVDPEAEALETREAIKSRIRRLAVEHDGKGRVAVLLLGDVAKGGIPTWTLEQTDATLRSGRDATYATDHPYQVLADGDDLPVIAVGRVPARPAEEARTVLEKIKRYEAGDDLGPWRRRIAYAAGEGHFGPADALLENLFTSMVTEFVPDEYDVSLTYAKASSIYCPPPSELSSTVLGQLDDGALLFNYVGHGTATSFDHLNWNGRSYPILKVKSLRHLPDDNAQHAIALLTCCSAGWYDLRRGKKSLGEAMLFHPGGPVAVIAGSRVTHPYANAVLQKEITRVLLSNRAETIGELDLLAMGEMLEVDEYDARLDALAAPVALAMKWPTGLADLRRMHIRLYNLLGDPALRIALPRARISDLKLDGTRLTGRVDGMDDGTVLVTVETDRTTPARADELVEVSGDDDPDFEAKARINYAIANDRLLLRAEGRITGGSFTIALPAEVPPDAAVVKAYAAGTDDAGRPVDAVGALRLSQTTVGAIP